MPHTPPPVKGATIQDAIYELQTVTGHFFVAHEQDAGKIIANPIWLSSF